jgi:nitrilase
VIGCCQAIQTSDIPDRFAFKRFYPPDKEWVNEGDSCVVDPEGRIVAGPLHEKEAALFWDLDPGLVAASR